MVASVAVHEQADSTSEATVFAWIDVGFMGIKPATDLGASRRLVDKVVSRLTAACQLPV